MKVLSSNLASLGLIAEKPRSRHRSKPSTASGQASALADTAQVRAPYSLVDAVADRLGVNSHALLAIIGMSRRTAARRKASGRLKPKEADRLFLVVRVLDEAARVFDSNGKAATWLRASHPLLWQIAPAQLLGSDAGAKAVTDELLRIEYGEFA